MDEWVDETETLELAAMEFLDACRDYADAPSQDAPLARHRYLTAIRRLQEEAARIPKKFIVDGSLVEPPNGSFVFARVQAHPIAGEVFHRDDREGHGDPAESPQRWWWHDAHRWVSWAQIERYAANGNRAIEPLGHREPVPCPEPPTT